jgi:hypothetical protein
MKLKAIVIMVLVVLLMGSVFGQTGRQPQFEVFGGVAIPLAPDYFKDYYKMGFSPHVQYVMFPTQQIGVSFGAAYEFFTFDGDKFMEDYFGDSIDGLKVEGSASVIELSVGLRPYITPAESSNQIFLFGMATYNFLKDEAEASYGGYSEKYTNDFNKFGLGAGAGMEIPAGDKFNIILQGIFRFIFTEEEKTNFVGITAGLVF